MRTHSPFLCGQQAQSNVIFNWSNGTGKSPYLVRGVACTYKAGTRVRMTKTSTYDALSSLAPLLRVRPELEDLCRFGGDWESSHDVAQLGWVSHCRTWRMSD
jgi:hypothetical protein